MIGVGVEVANREIEATALSRAPIGRAQPRVALLGGKLISCFGETIPAAPIKAARLETSTTTKITRL